MSSIKHLRLIIENIQGLVCTHDMDGKILAVNEASAISIQTPASELIGKNMCDILAPEVKPHFYLYLQSIAQNKISEGVMCIITKQGEYRYWKYRNIRIDEKGKPSFIVGCSQDVTDHILLEKELKKAKLEAEELGKAKEQFLANMSHEIRTPMNAIMGFSELLLGTPLNTAQQEYIQAINNSSKNLLTIINDILDLTKIRSGKMTFEKVRFELPDLLKGMKMLLQTKAHDKGIAIYTTIDTNVPAGLVGDSIRLNQILLNLAGNAVKFTEKGSVSLHVSLAKRNQHHVWLSFSVKDTGIGIPKNKLTSVFESFTQAGNDITRKYGGTGLGLSITQQLVEMQKGSIAVKSTYGKGSEFTVTLKFKEAKKRPVIKQLPVTRMPAKYVSHVLLVEDNPLNQLLATTVLQQKGFTVDVAVNGKEAIEKIKVNNYHLVLMDVRMPVMDGYKATRYIRKHLTTPQKNVPIIALTANATTAEIEKCSKAGMNDYLAKPFEQKSLMEKISKLTQLNVDEPIQLKPKAGEPHTQHYINLSYLKDASHGKAAFVRQMINLFLRETPPALQLMNTQFENKEWKQLSDSAHKLKANFQTVGAVQSTEYTTLIEDNAKSDHHELIESLMAKLNKDLPLIVSELKENLDD